MVKIIKQIVSPGIINARSYGYGNPCNYITVHQTGNKNAGADAQAHANIQSKLNPRQASWQYQVDDSEIIQSFPDEVMCWAATDGRGKGNTESIHVEICINSDGDYKKAIQNAADLVRHLKDKHNAEIKQHHDWYDKNCPQQLREGHEGITWDDFIGMVNGKVFDRDEKVKSLQIENASTDDRGKRVESIYKGKEGLDFYSKPSWNDKHKVGTFAFGMGWTIRKKIKVDGAYMFEVENSNGDVFYITAADKYVRVENKAKPKPKKAWYIGKRAESKVDDLRYYRKPSWNDDDVAGHLQEKYGFPKILDKVKVGSAYQFKVQNSKGAVYYVTASDEYIRVE